MSDHDHTETVTFAIYIHAADDVPTVDMAISTPLAHFSEMLDDIAAPEWRKHVEDGLVEAIRAARDEGRNVTDDEFQVERPLTEVPYGPADVITRVLDTALGEDADPDAEDFVCPHCTRSMAEEIVAALGAEGYQITESVQD